MSWLGQDKNSGTIRLDDGGGGLAAGFDEHEVADNIVRDAGMTIEDRGEPMRTTNSPAAIITATLIFGIITLTSFAGQVLAQRPGEDEVLQATEKLAPTVQEIAQKLWDLSEVSLLEIKSSAYLKALLKKNGFAITSEKTASVPTAFVAEYGKGKPIIGILLEYDALPGLGNEAVPKKQPRKDGVTSGHGCGHNLIGGGSMGAALAIKNLMQEKEIPGTLRVYGAAAEESEGAKVFMARAGVFDDVDAMLHWHPMDFAHVCNLRTVAATHMIIKFKGKAAHAGLYPWRGRSAWTRWRSLLTA